MGKKQWGRGSQCPTESELTSAQIPRALFLPHREVSPVLFSQTCNSFTVTFFPSSSFRMSYLALSLGGALYSELLICLKGGKEVALGRKYCFKHMECFYFAVLFLVP